MNLDLSEGEGAALTANLNGSDRYPFSEGIHMLQAIPAKLRPEPARKPLPKPKV
jgi:hypothetical protein